MAASQAFLHLITYSPGLVSADSRPLEVVRAIEHAIPGSRLAWTVSDEGQFIPLPEHEKWVVDETTDGGFPLLCNGDEHWLVSVFGSGMRASEAPDRQPQFEVHAQWPLDTAGVDAAVDVLVGVAEGSRAFWGQTTPEGAALDIARQTRPTAEGVPLPPRGLPLLKPSWEMHRPEVPHRLGWLNYWSAATARLIGFPDPTRDVDLLSRARCTASGGWRVQLTEAPFDLDNPAHMNALLRAYERFPMIGGRSTPY